MNFVRYLAQKIADIADIHSNQLLESLAIIFPTDNFYLWIF